MNPRFNPFCWRFMLPSGNIWYDLLLVYINSSYFIGTNVFFQSLVSEEGNVYLFADRCYDSECHFAWPAWWIEFTSRFKLKFFWRWRSCDPLSETQKFPKKLLWSLWGKAVGKPKLLSWWSISDPPRRLTGWWKWHKFAGAATRTEIRIQCTETSSVIQNTLKF